MIFERLRALLIGFAPGAAFLRALSLDEPDRVTPQMIVYASRAPAWDKMDPSLPAFAEMPEGSPESVMAAH